MSQWGMKRRLNIMVILLSIGSLILWVMFFLSSAHNMKSTNEDNMREISRHIIDRLESQLLGLESLSYTLSQSALVQDFVCEKDVKTYFDKSESVNELVHALATSSDYEGHLILYGKDGTFCRFMGSLGNTSASYTANYINSVTLPRHTVFLLEGVYYIGYIREIYRANETVGYIMLLQEESTLLSLFSPHLVDDTLQVSLISDNKVVTSSEKLLLSKTADELRAQSGLFLNRTIGFAPFEVWVTIEKGYLSQVYTNFAIAALATLLLFGCMFFIFLSFAKRYFWKPLLSVMADVETLGTPLGVSALRKTGEWDFDRLVTQVNLMLMRLEDRSNALFKTKIELQKAEIERQRSLVISLKKQINAHFAINVLNHIKLLSEQGQIDQASAMSDGLSFLLRYANAGDEFIDGMEEFLILQKYITVMENWMPGRFTVDFDWDDLLSGVNIPRMLIQPILENAITHGFTDRKSGGIIRVRAVVESSVITFTITDNGVGITPQELAELSNKISTAEQPAWTVSGISHVALPNIQRRIYLYYGSGYGLRVTSKLNKGTTVILRFPTNCSFD